MARFEADWTSFSGEEDVTCSASAFSGEALAEGHFDQTGGSRLDPDHREGPWSFGPERPHLGTSTTSPLLGVASLTDWLVSIYGRDSTYVAFRALLSIPPDSATGPLSVTARGLPALVSMHAAGWCPPLEAAGGDTIVSVPDPLVDGAEHGRWL